MVNAKTITFEQPLNEHLRVCLRLELLFSQIDQHLLDGSEWGTRATLSTLFDVLNTIDRPDLKGKFTKALSRYAADIARYEAMQHVDTAKLRSILQDIDQLTDALHATHGKLGDTLRKNTFLNTIRQHATQPGGACNFSTPAYQLWLKRPTDERLTDLNRWLKECDSLRRIVNILLRLTRDGKVPNEHIAERGFYQQALDPKLECQLIRVSVPLALALYPEISVGPHRLSIHFFHSRLEKGVQVKQAPLNSIKFLLTCCGQI